MENPQPNFYDLAEERRGLRKAVRESEESETAKKVLEKTLEAVNEEAKSFSIKEAGGLKPARDILKADKERSDRSAWINEEVIEQEIGPSFADISELEENLADLRDFEMRRLREMQSDPHAQKAHERLLKTIRDEKNNLEDRLPF